MEDYSSSEEKLDSRMDFEDWNYDNDLRRRSDDPSTEVFTKESISAAQRETLDKVMELLSVPEHQARTLLIHFRWDLEKLYNKLGDEGIDQIYAEAGLTELDQNDDLSASQNLTSVICGICSKEVSPDLATKMYCGHHFCNNCWTEYLITKINEDQSRSIKCLDIKCNSICDEVKIRNVLGSHNPNISAKFERLLLESYIDDIKSIKWCPSIPQCGNAIRVKGDNVFNVECKCGREFCFNCLSDAHSPCSCLMWKLWAKKFEEESCMINWLSENTRPCPKCYMPIEKNGGDKFLSCLCGVTFCWLCSCATSTFNEEHRCWKEGDGQHHDGKIEIAKNEPWRYIHYHNRYKSYTDLFQFESSIRETIQESILKLEKKEAIKNSKWVHKGILSLFKSRRYIAYTFVFAYYMFGDNEMKKKENLVKQYLFEDQQRQLEENVGRLSRLIESPFHLISKDGIIELKLKVLDLSNIVDSLCKKLYECIENDFLELLQQSGHAIATYKTKVA